MSHNTMFEKDMRLFFSKPFDSLERLILITAYDAFEFFDFLNWQSMTNLRMLSLEQTDFSQSLHLI